MNKTLSEIIASLSDETLIKASKELMESTIPDDAVCRKIAAEIFNSGSVYVGQILLIAPFIAFELAERLHLYKMHCDTEYFNKHKI